MSTGLRYLLTVAALTAGCGRPAANTMQEAEWVQAEPCRHVESQAELTRCWTQEAQNVSGRVTERQRRLVALLDDQESAALFDRAHEEWEAYRTAYCRAVSQVSESGSAAQLESAHCQARLSTERERELEGIMREFAR